MINKLFITTYYLIAYILMKFSYSEFIVPIYGYEGFVLNPNINKIIEGLLILIFISLLLPGKYKKPSDIFLHVQLLFPILPMLVLYGAIDYPREYMYLSVFSYLLAFLISRFVQLKYINFGKISPFLLKNTLIILAYLIIGSIIAQGGLQYLNFDLSKVYDFRKEAASNLPGIYGYLDPLTTGIVLPMALLLAVVTKDKITAVLAVIGSIMLFALTSHKGPLFFPIMILSLYFILKVKKPIQLLLIGIIGILVLSIIDFIKNGNEGWIGALMVQRVIMLPAWINFQYYDFFSVNPFCLWSDSKITLGLLAYPYPLSADHMIGLYYFGNAATGANTGWIGSGYMQAGAIGVLVYGIIFGFLLSILDSFCKKIDKNILTSVAVVPVFILMLSSDLPTAFLNHGILFLLLLFAFFPTIKSA